MGKKHISDEDLLDRLQKYASELGRPPSQNEMNRSGLHAASTYADRFGSWNDALKTAGLETGVNELNGRPPIPKDDLLSDLKSVTEKVEEIPSERVYKVHGSFSIKTHCKRFGGWNAALRAAGFEPIVESNLSLETLLDALEDFADELGRTPTSDEMDQQGPYTAGPYKRMFGSWNQALQHAGFDVHQVRGVTDKELIEDLKELSKELDRVPRTSDMREQGDWGCAIYQDRFGSWNKSLQIAGFEPNDRWRIPQTELLEELRRLAAEIGHPPTTREMNQWGRFTYNPCIREFGTWQTALQAADPDLVEEYLQTKSERIPFGENWPSIREQIIERDGGACLRCGMKRSGHKDTFGCDLHVHHRIPRRRFYHDPESSIDDANSPSNLLTLCVQCHRVVELLPVQPTIE